MLEKYIASVIESFYEKEITVKELPSSGRIRVRECDAFIALHVLYAPPINRGNVCLLPDFPKLYDVEIGLKVDREITSVRAEPDGCEIPFEQSCGTVSFKLPPFRLHQLIILK